MERPPTAASPSKRQKRSAADPREKDANNDIERDNHVVDDAGVASKQKGIIIVDKGAERETCNAKNNREEEKEEEEEAAGEKDPEVAADVREANEREIEPLKHFPKDGPSRYILHRIAGGDVLQTLDEHDAEGCLEIDPTSGETAMVWAELKDGKGIIAGRIDYAGPIRSTTGSGPTTYLRAVACKAYIDNGTWIGPIHRHGGMPGVNFMGHCLSSGVQIARCGREDVSSNKPLHFDLVHSIRALVDESEPDDSEKDR